MTSYSDWKTKVRQGRIAFEECVKEDDIKDERAKIIKRLNEQHRLCEAERFSVLKRFFSNDDSKNTIDDLLKALFMFYRERISKSEDFSLTFREFLHMFPRDVEGKNINRRQHVFEALCRILLAFNYEGNITSLGGGKKRFYDGMRCFLEGKKRTDPKDILKKNVNEGSSEGVVDIFIEVLKSNTEKLEEKEPSCVRGYSNTEGQSKDKDLYILIQAKFFDVEKSSADMYDVNKIATRAEDMKDEIEKRTGKSADYNIVLMVNDKNLLGDKIKNARHNDFRLVTDIFGTQEINAWFQALLFEIRSFSLTYRPTSSYEDEEAYKKFKIDVLKISDDHPITRQQQLQLKFHQNLIVSLTESFYNNAKLRRRNFIWGAVPRSGKSYMIGGLIDRRSDTGNNILLVLGAKSETETQFLEIFKYDNFHDYQVVTTKSGMLEGRKEGKSKYILILSQEKIKVNEFSKLRKDFSPILDEGNRIDLYFDEIHKGGSTQKAKDDVVDILSVKKLEVDIFVMVTATYAKPSIAYTSKVGDNKVSEIFNWTYEDTQLMKEINNPMKEAEFRNRIVEGNEIQREVKRETLDEVLKREYLKLGPDYLDTISREYSIYPELVMIQPFIDTKITPKDAFGLSEESFNIHKELFKLKCTAIPKTKSELMNVSDIFVNSSNIEKLANFIGKVGPHEEYKHDVLEPNCVYGRLREQYGYDITSNRHIELWFLPDKDLYRESDIGECRERAKTEYKASRTLTNNPVEEEFHDKPNNTYGLPNIEPLARGLTITLMNNPFFEANYHIAIVNNQKVEQYKVVGKELGKNFYDNHYGKRVSQYPGGNTKLKEWIEKQEKLAYASKKSLIVLTGSMLRLGISLPCADIAFNMDSVKSVDVNYQTMFRVLTERQTKSYGYYFDFYPERAISFLYDYSLVYGGGTNKPKGVELVRSLLPQFNYNGFGIIKKDTSEALGLYGTLIKQLCLTKKDYDSKVIEAGRRHTTAKLLSNIPEAGRLEMMRMFALFLKHKNLVKRANIRKEIMKGVNREEYDQYMPTGAQAEEVEVEEKPDIQSLAEQLDNVTSILAMFSAENDNCDTIESCLDKLISSTDAKKDVEELCRCNVDRIDALACYMVNLEKVTVDSYKKFLTELRAFHRRKDSPSLEVIEFENNIFSNIKKRMSDLSVKGGGLIYSSSYQEILDIIHNYLPVKKTEKDKLGEVFTPAELINKMLDQLPKSVWNNPNLKWLDPANGVGNFPMIAFSRLNEGLSKKMPNEKKRKEHIVKNMLYMVEFNGKNVAVAKKIFGKDANIYCGSFLEDGWKKAFGIDKYDVIMGNPPYNTGGVQKGGGVFWKEFVFEGVENLKTNGYLVYVHPLGWRKPKGERASAGDIFDRFKKEGHLISLTMNNVVRYTGFPNVDYYLWQKKNTGKDTLVNVTFNGLTFEGQLDLSQLPFIPNYIDPTVVYLLKKLMNVNEQDKLSIVRNQDFKPTKENLKGTGIPYAYYYVPDSDTYLPAFRDTNDKPDYASLNKVILTYKAGKKPALLYPKYYSSVIGTTANTMYQTVDNKDQGERLIHFFDSDLIKALLKITQYSEAPNYINEYKVLNLLPNPVLASVPTMTKEEKNVIKLILDNQPQPKKKRTLKVVDEIPSRRTRKSSSKSSSSSRGSKLKSRSSSKSSASNKKGGKPKTLKRGTKLHKRHTLRKKSKKN